MTENNSRNKGFTLIEVLAAIVITSTIASLILSFLTSSIKSFNVTENALQLQNDAQSTMNIMIDNIMSSSIVISAKNVDNNPIDLLAELTEDTEYILGSITFLKVIDQINYIETYEYIKEDNEILYSLAKEGDANQEISGIFTSNLDESGFILQGKLGNSISKSNYITITLNFDLKGQKLSLTNTARFRNGN